MISVDELIKRSNALYSAQQPMQSLWQVMAEHFYPERADFTRMVNIGEEFGSRLMDSYPVIVRRDLADSFAAMLRDGDDWFKVDVVSDGLSKLPYDARAWLQRATYGLRRLINQRRSGFMRATKEGDHDFATFGQCVISVEPTQDRRGIMFRCWHLRDMAWADGYDGMIAQTHRKWMPYAYELIDIFKDVHQSVRDMAKDKPMEEVKVRHIVMPSKMYGDSRYERFKNVSLFIDVTNSHLMEAVGIDYDYYVIPRATTIEGSQYAYSPATVAGLPSARTLQAMTFTLLEAGERLARPPMVATAEVIRSDVNLDPDGITYVDKKYDEKTGAALRPLYQDKGGFPYGLNMREGVMGMLASAFRLDKLALPDAGQMTAYEVSERMKQFRRENLPLFAPLETEYNGQLIEAAFQVAFKFGMLGAPMDLPTSLQGQETRFDFKSPLKDLEGETRVIQFQRAGELQMQAAQIDPSIVHDIDVRKAFRETVESIDAPMHWLRDLKEVQMRAEQQQAAMEAQAAAEQQGAAQAAPAPANAA